MERNRRVTRPRRFHLGAGKKFRAQKNFPLECFAQLDKIVNTRIAFQTEKMPVSVYISDKPPTNEGAGFVVAYQQSNWLITAAHVPIGSNSFQNDISALPNEILARSPNDSKRLWLFDARNDRSPNFLYHSHNGTNSDLICLPLKADHRPVGADIHNLETALSGTLPVGAVLTLHGYPNRSGLNIWPESTTQLHVVESNTDFHRTGEDIACGYSGGPALLGEVLAGMAIGSTNGSGVIVSIGLIKRVIEAHLKNI